jgi:tellurium resistance protein TerD
MLFHSNEVTVGLGWTAPGGMDLDASVLVLRDLDGDGVPDICACVDYRALSWENGAIEHQGDNLTGEGDGDDETIFVHLGRVPSNIEQLVVCVNIYTPGANFSAVNDAYVRVSELDGDVNSQDGRKEVELARYLRSYSESANVFFRT